MITWCSECWLHQASWSRDWNKFGRCPVRSTIFGQPPSWWDSRHRSTNMIHSLRLQPKSNSTFFIWKRRARVKVGVDPAKGSLTSKVDSILTPAWDTVQGKQMILICVVSLCIWGIFDMWYDHSVLFTLCFALFYSPLLLCFQHRNLKPKLINTLFIRSLPVFIQVKTCWHVSWG